MPSLEIRQNIGVPSKVSASIPPGPSPFQDLMRAELLAKDDLDRLSMPQLEELYHQTNLHSLLPLLLERGLLTQYQAERIRAGKKFGLILGNYRVLSRLGGGGMGVVFKAEHRFLRRQVAVKVLAQPHGLDPITTQRFNNEIRIVAQLQHPNIVAALDAGVCSTDNPDDTPLYYYTMEYIPGEDLEALVQARGQLAITEACDYVYQIASALAEAHQHHLVHRDIKPSNILVTPDGQAKLLDFGLVRQLRQRVTEPGTVLGTIDYMAPEQAYDSSGVDIRADIYGLGATLFWCLTGRTPYEAKGTIAQEIMTRLAQSPPSIRTIRLDIPLELDAIIARMLSSNREQRYATPEAVMRAVLHFLKPDLRDHLMLGSVQSGSDLNVRFHSATREPKARHQILIVDDDPHIREFCRFMLQSPNLQCTEAGNGLQALEQLTNQPYDVVLLDIDLPELSGIEICKRIREAPPNPHLKIIMLSGRATGDEMAHIMLAGADDYLAKPVSFVQLQARVKSALRLKDVQDKSDVLTQHLMALNQQLEQNLQARDNDLINARNALVLGLAELVNYRDIESGRHLSRMQCYSRCLAEELATNSPYASLIDSNFIQLLENCVPLHDIGKAALPDHILSKPGKLTSDERYIMETHATMGAETLEKVGRRHGFAQTFFQMATEIARHHHEHWDGKGYPDGLIGEEIPLSARIVAITDVYDALRTRRIYKPALSHSATVKMMTQEFQGHFDPSMLPAFESVASEFEKIYREMAD